MSITDELRGFIDGADGYELWCPRHKTELTAIANRIDIAHKHAIGYVDDRDPETMAENGWIRTPTEIDWQKECRKWERECRELAMKHADAEYMASKARRMRRVVIGKLVETWQERQDAVRGNDIGQYAHDINELTNMTYMLLDLLVECEKPAAREGDAE